MKLKVVVTYPVEFSVAQGPLFDLVVRIVVSNFSGFVDVAVFGQFKIKNKYCSNLNNVQVFTSKTLEIESSHKCNIPVCICFVASV